MLLTHINIKPNKIKEYPFNLSLFKSEVDLEIKNPVTIIVGDNGTGKSSLLKLLQAKLGLIEIKLPNKDKMQRIKTDTVDLSPKLRKLSGFFFESITFINYIQYIESEIKDSKLEIERVDQEYKNKSDYSRIMAKTPFSKTIYELKNMYSNDLSQSSHGEAFLDFFSSRIKENQIYLLDEPETPLSFQNQLTLVALIIFAVKKNCQFIIATHSPVISAIPNANIFEIIEDKLIEKNYEDIESFKLLKQFLNNKKQFLRHFEDIE